MRQATGFVIGSIVWVLTAGCSGSSGAAGDIPNSNAATDGGGNGGEGGSTPFGPGGDAGGRGGGVTADAACTSAASSICTKLDSCSHFLIQQSFGDVATCSTRYKISCMASLAAPGTAQTPAFAGACYAALAAGTCGDLLDGKLPAACQPPQGSLAAGAACGVGGQCSTNDCRRATGSFCGTCTALAAAGASCAAADCQPGLTCAKNLVCTAYGTMGAACSANQPCGFPMVCKSSACAAPDPIGTACVTTASTCDSSQGLFCNPVSKLCDTAHLTTAGQTCGVISNALTLCEAGGFCKRTSSTSSTGTCLAPAAAGATCSLTIGPACLSPAECQSGVCKLPDASTCK